MISRQIKQQIIDQTNIVEVVGEVVQLTKKGSSYFGLCPFHDDKNPSMSVNNEKKLFNCFSCNTKGTVIYFWSKFNHITEDQATIDLAKRLGIEISSADSKKAERNNKLYKVMTEATNFYQFYLNNSQEGVLAKKYLSERQIDESIIEKLKIGLSSTSSNYLNQALNSKKIPEMDQLDVGLVQLNNNNEAFDVFRDRIMFPITNPSGQVVGFSGRIYKKSDQPKYINSIDNEIFHKGQILYHFYEGQDAIKKNDKIYLLEGFMDVIACMKADINNVVATMGTALTDDHIKLILNLTKNIILCFDGDEAGIKAMKRSCMMLSNYNIIPKAIVLPNNMDPDEYLKAYGKDGLINYFNQNEKSAYDWLYDLAKKNLILGDLISVENFKKVVFNFIRLSKQKTVIDYFLKKLSIDLSLNINTLSSDFGKMEYISMSELPVIEADNKKITKENKPVKIKKKVIKAYQIILRHMVESKDEFLDFKEKFDDSLYLDMQLMIYFDFIKKMSLFYVEHDVMDHDDFMLIASRLDEANGNNKYSLLAKELLENNMINVSNKIEFEQCLQTISECEKDLSQTKLYNQAIDSLKEEDIKKFREVKKENVKIISKEE